MAEHKRWSATQTTDYPHAGNCPGCRFEYRCNVCGARYYSLTQRCVNGRCMDCHAKVCTPGGALDEGGHRYGNPLRGVRIIADTIVAPGDKKR